MQEMAPKYLYKILSCANWSASREQEALLLSRDDDAFIHFSTKEQLDAIIAKYWSHTSDYVVLTVETSKLKGKLVHESNPGGTKKYYHLYEGSIPTDSVIDSKLYNPV